MSAAQQLTTKDLKKGFGVGHMTIYNWRHGTATKDKLPFKKDAKGRVSFPSDKIEAWAKKNGVPFKMPKVLAERLKPGPAKKADGSKKAAKTPPSKKAVMKKGPAKKAPVAVKKSAKVVRLPTKKLPDASPAIGQVAQELASAG